MSAKPRPEYLIIKTLGPYIIYWILYLVFFTYQRYTAYIGLPDEETLLTSFLVNLIYLPDVIIVTHLIVNLVIPKFYFRDRYGWFYAILGTTILLYPVLPYLIRILVINVYIKDNAEAYDMGNYFAAVLILVFGITLLSFGKITRFLKEDAAMHQKLENEKLATMLKLKESEVKLLKSQIHPHFLFNTLNNLYSLSLEKSEKTPDLIIRLADLLSYIIYEGNAEKVPLSKEIEFIKSYVELQRVRYESCDIALNINGETINKFIAPMILHTFIENSFKHGADKDTGEPWIEITISAREDSLHMAVVNSIKNFSEGNNSKTGIGISNAMKRLELQYQGKHELIINRSDNMYTVNLRLDL